jgi:hypothetical protein
VKREWIGFGLLLGLLVLGLLTTRRMERTCEDLSRQFRQAGTLALAEDWEGADKLLRKAKGRWDGSWHLTAALTDHEPMEEVDCQLEELAIYQKQRDRLSFCALCARIARQIEDLGDAHGLTWWNLL